MGLKGSCLCGEISYEIDSVDMPIVHCHCQTCRKAHAAPFASTAGVKRENFRWLKGASSILCACAHPRTQAMVRHVKPKYEPLVSIQGQRPK